MQAGGCSVVRILSATAWASPPRIADPELRGAGRGPVLKPGMTLAIEPMVNLGRSDVACRMTGGQLLRETGNRPRTLSTPWPCLRKV